MEKLAQLKLTLGSAFQPIISVVHSKIVGHEALLRGESGDEGELSAAELLLRLKQAHSSAQINSLCARLHLSNFARQADPGWLFLNVSPDSLVDREYVVRHFGKWLREAQVEPRRIVAEIIETEAFDESQLSKAVAGFRDLGCLVAIDDFGAGESNFERVWRLRPDIVKLDRRMIVLASENPTVQRLLPSIVSLMHESGCLVLVEGVETEVQALIASESNADFLQGYYFARPAARCEETLRLRPVLGGLSSQLQFTHAEQGALDLRFFASYFAGLEACVSALEDGLGMEDACNLLLAVAGVQRIYELDHHGRQVGPNFESPTTHDPRFSPCADADGADWSRRPYFQNAIAQPGRVHACRPYLSIRDARSCVTISVAFGEDPEYRVLCADLDLAHAEPPSFRQAFRSYVGAR